MCKECSCYPQFSQNFKVIIHGHKLLHITTRQLGSYESNMNHKMTLSLKHKALELQKITLVMFGKHK